MSVAVMVVCGCRHHDDDYQCPGLKMLGCFPRRRRRRSSVKPRWLSLLPAPAATCLNSTVICFVAHSLLSQLSNRAAEDGR